MKILFISPNAGLAGAQVLLLNLLQHLKSNNKDVKFDLILEDGGILLDEYKNQCRTFLKRKSIKSKNPFISLFYKIYFKMKGYDIIYSYTILNGNTLHDLSFLKKPVISHIHEMKFWIEKSGTDNTQKVIKYSDYYIAASNSVKNVLVQELQLSPNIIDVIYEYTDINSLVKNQKSLKKLLNIENDAIIIGGCGAEDYRKGKDLFVKIAELFLSKELSLNVYFVWIGGTLRDETKEFWENSPHKSKIHFLDQFVGARDYFGDFDVFLMTSREDPFPVVNLEVGALGKPIISFAESGGTYELLSFCPELLVYNWNLQEMADIVERLLRDHKLRKALGLLIKSEIENKYTIEKIAPSIVTLIESKINEYNRLACH